MNDTSPTINHPAHRLMQGKQVLSVQKLDDRAIIITTTTGEQLIATAQADGTLLVETEPT